MEKLVLGRLQVDLKSSGILQTIDLFHYRERSEQRLLKAALGCRPSGFQNSPVLSSRANNHEPTAAL
jgi:hypothetical protein